MPFEANCRRLAVVHGDPVAVELGDAVGRARIERRGFLLRDFLHQTVELRRGCLVEPGLLLHAEDPDRFQQSEHADRVGIGRIFRLSKLTPTWLWAARL